MTPLIFGFGNRLIPFPTWIGTRLLLQRARQGSSFLSFMSADHHRLRNFVVSELPRQGKALTPAWLAGKLEMDLDRVWVMLDEIERHHLFLARDQAGAVVSAYPVTIQPSDHHLIFRSGEATFTVGALDAIAAPFILGYLRNESLSVKGDSVCHHCGEPLYLQVDSHLDTVSGPSSGGLPLVFSPLNNFEALPGSTRVNGISQKSVFFWSEDHAREYRKTMTDQAGIYLPLFQAKQISRQIQRALFIFSSKN